MDRRFGNPIIFTSFVWAKVSFRWKPLLSPTAPFAKLPGNWQFALRRLPFSLVLLTETAVTLAFWTQYRWFSQAFGFFLLFHYVAQPGLEQFLVDFNQEDENRQQNQQVFEQG